jgi:predicted flap endonuclease-1-like 5' DNA nuclease
MPVAKSLYQYPRFPAYADPFRTTETAVSLWTEYWRASANAMFWWTERWMQAPMTWTAWASSARTAEQRPLAAVIDLAQAAAARFAADIAEPAAEIVQSAVETPTAVAKDAAEVVETAVLTLKPAPDDLTRLVGIGPKLAVALAERGVTRFDHIAAWTEKDLAEVDKALDLKGRAARDAWIAQAKRFAAER